LIRALVSHEATVGVAIDTNCFLEFCDFHLAGVEESADLSADLVAALCYEDVVFLFIVFDFGCFMFAGAGSLDLISV
jgi:hypothetical protein